MRILTLENVIEKTTMPGDSIVNNSKAGHFPDPVELLDGRVGWIESEVEAWIRDMVEDRDIDKNGLSIWAYDTHQGHSSN
jgi:predicted DNA-binding transcriptional regulator AlpA